MEDNEGDVMEEVYLREQLAFLKKHYEKAAKPYIDKLIEIQSRRSPRPVMVSLVQARNIGFMLPQEMDK